MQVLWDLFAQDSRDARTQDWWSPQDRFRMSDAGAPRDTTKRLLLVLSLIQRGISYFLEYTGTLSLIIMCKRQRQISSGSNFVLLVCVRQLPRDMGDANERRFLVQRQYISGNIVRKWGTWYVQVQEMIRYSSCHACLPVLITFTPLFGWHDSHSLQHPASNSRNLIYMKRSRIVE